MDYLLFSMRLSKYQPTCISFMVQIETMNEMDHLKIECEDKAHKA